jgi:alpha-D-ribose 1-methylphosphonate 5-triphosphate synthase subunit PhnH
MDVLPAVEGGFADPVFNAQTVFRALMDAMAQPGRIVRVPAGLANPPSPLSPSAAAIALTLCDHDPPVWLDAALAAGRAVRDWLGFHASVPIVQVPAEAHFALVCHPAELIALDNFSQGTQEYPDRSATLILGVDSLTDGVRLKLTGPGIESFAVLAPTPLPRHFVEQWKGNNQRFPRGIDVVLAAPDAVACLPRTTRIAPMEG